MDDLFVENRKPNEVDSRTGYLSPSGRAGRAPVTVAMMALVSVIAAACVAGGVGSPSSGTTVAPPSPTISHANGGASDVGAASLAATDIPGLFAGLPYAMDLPGWLGGGPARWDAQIQSLTATGTAPEKLTILKGFDAPITGDRFFGIDAASDLAVFVQSGALPAGISAEQLLNAADQTMIAAAQQDGGIVSQPVTDRLTSPVGGEAARIRYVTRSVNVAGDEFDEARVGYAFQSNVVVYNLFFTFPVSDDRYDDVAGIVSTFHLQPVPVVDVVPGGCFDIDQEVATGSWVATILPCSDPHYLEVITLIPYPATSGAPYPGKAAIDRYVDPLCSAAFVSYVGRPDAESIYNYAYLAMTEAEWNAGERRVSCGVGSDDHATIKGSVNGASQ